MHQFLKFILFWNNTLYVSDCLFVHHQGFKTVHKATGICQADTVASLLQAGNSICLTYNCCFMYSLEFLMMDGKTVWNM